MATLPTAAPPLRDIELPAEVHIKAAVGVILAVLSVLSLYRPEIETVRAVVGFVIAAAYVLGVLTVAVHDARPFRIRRHGRTPS